MSFTVHMRKRIVFVRVLCIVMIVLLTCFTNWRPMREYLMEDGAYLIFMVLMAVFVALFAYTFYVSAPMIKCKPILLAVGVIAAVCVLAVGSAVLFLGGGNVDTPRPSVPSERTTPELREPAGKTPYSTQDVTFEISSDWIQAEGSELFYADGGRQVYGLNGVSALGSYAPQEFLEELVNHYRTTNQFTDLEAPEELTAWQSGDGVECQVADLTGYKESVIYTSSSPQIMQMAMTAPPCSDVGQIIVLRKFTRPYGMRIETIWAPKYQITFSIFAGNLNWTKKDQNYIQTVFGVGYRFAFDE